MMRSLWLVALLVAGCQAAPQQAPLLSKKPAVELRTMQSRVFDSGDKNRILREVIGTLQDLGYSLDKVAASAGTVTATKLAVLQLSASVYPHGRTQTVVRADALVKINDRFHQVDDPTFYQSDFFAPLQQAMLLTALSLPDDKSPSISTDTPSDHPAKSTLGSQEHSPGS